MTPRYSTWRRGTTSSPVDQRLGLLAAVRLDEADHDVDAPLRERVCLLQHPVCLADARREPDVELEPARAFPSGPAPGSPPGAVGWRSVPAFEAPGRYGPDRTPFKSRAVAGAGDAAKRSVGCVLFQPGRRSAAAASGGRRAGDWARDRRSPPISWSAGEETRALRELPAAQRAGPLPANDGEPQDDLRSRARAVRCATSAASRPSSRCGFPNATTPCRVIARRQMSLPRP